MAKIELRPDLIASRYDGIPVGPRLAYSFETQQGIPVDGGNPLLRDLSPFTLRFVVPTLVSTRTNVDVGLIGRAGRSTEANDAAANAVRSLFGASNVVGTEEASLASLKRIVSAGQIVSGATTTTERSVLVDNRTAADIAWQIEQMLQTPPLTLLVNPKEVSISYGTVQQFGNRTRKGFVFERWGENQPTVSFSGSTGAFIAGANPLTGRGPFTQESESPSGLQAASKRDSAAFQNFISLYHFYRNNGYIYDTINGTEAHLMAGAIAIDYDQWTYVGHMESFDYSYQEGMPHRLEWSMEFVVDRMYDVSQPPVSVQPMRSPQPNPSYPSRTAQSFTNRPDGLRGGLALGLSGVTVSGQGQFAHTPLNLLLPSGIK